MYVLITSLLPSNLAHAAPVAAKLIQRSVFTVTIYLLYWQLGDIAATSVCTKVTVYSHVALDQNNVVYHN